MPFDKPIDIRRAYENGLPGTPFSGKELDIFLGKSNHPLFGAAAYNLQDSGKGKLVLLHELVKSYDKNFGETESQDTGDCTSHGTRNAGDLTRASEIAAGDRESFLVRGATEPIYGARGHSGQGMSVVRAANFITNGAGFLIRENYEDLGIDLSKYNARIGMNWGSRGVPDAVVQEAKKNSFETASLVATTEEARDAIANGYALTVGSNYGYSSRRDKYGVAKRSKSWNHCMCWAAVDDTKQRLNETLFLVINSWGKWNGGPKVLGQPEGSFWIRESDAAGMLRQNQSYAISNFDGFPPRDIDISMFDKVEELLG
jgi:hypothetical protein